MPMFSKILYISVRLQLLKKSQVTQGFRDYTQNFGTKFMCLWTIVLKKNELKDLLSLTIWGLPAPPEPARELHKLYFCYRK